MSDARKPRDLDTRTHEENEVYTPPSSLPDPHPEKGFVFRWIATHVLGKPVPQNVSMQLRDGWVPVKAADHPEMGDLVDASGNIEVGGLMLCKMPEKRAKAREQYYATQAQQQMQSVDNTYMKQQDPRMPLFAERKSATTRGANFGSGSNQ